MLDSLSSDAENFAGLFDGKYVTDSVQDQFREPFNTALILLTVFVAEPLRGHDLGAWLAAEVIARMASVSDTFVLLYPHPAGETPEDVSEIQAIDALNRYWRKAGLVPIDEHPGFLGQSNRLHFTPRRALRAATRGGRGDPRRSERSPFRHSLTRIASEMRTASLAISSSLFPR
jgi:hypothetical protein